MNPIDVLNQIWTQILEVTSLFVIPDWGALIGLLPVLIVIGLIAPFLTFTMLGALIYLVRRPRVKVRFVEGPRVAEIGPGVDTCSNCGLVLKVVDQPVVVRSSVGPKAGGAAAA